MREPTGIYRTTPAPRASFVWTGTAFALDVVGVCAAWAAAILTGAWSALWVALVIAAGLFVLGRLVDVTVDGHRGVR